ncbi:MAG: hypothetical protein JW847_00565 [Candidatus Omnitrophica bacterium]|nr:hypothetical protein [Candidatus Omnitrophota bacterium]
MDEGLLTLVKIVMAVLLLPVLWACGVVFHGHILSFPGEFDEFFLWGMFGFLMLFLFFYQFDGVYEFGQKIMTSIFQFMFPIGRIFVRIIPFYLTVILLVYCAVVNLLGVKVSDHYFMFFAGFAFTMHVILTAQDLQQQEKAFIKPAYLFMMVIVTVFMIFVTVLLFDLVFMKFTFPEFFKQLSDETWANYSRVGEFMMFGR